MRISPIRFGRLGIIAALMTTSIGSLPAEAEPSSKRAESRPEVVLPRPPSISLSELKAPEARTASGEALRRDAQAMVEFATRFNMASQNIPAAANAISRVYAEATEGVLLLPSQERNAIARSWVISLNSQTRLVRDGFAIMGPVPVLTDPAMGRQVIGFGQARSDVLAVMSKADDNVQQISALVIGWTPQRNKEVLAAMKALQMQGRGDIMRAFAAMNTAMAATMAQEAPSGSLNSVMGSMYTVLATAIDVQTGNVSPRSASDLIAQRIQSMSAQSLQGRQKVLALQAQIKSMAEATTISPSDRLKLQSMIGVIGDYNKAFDAADQITAVLAQVNPLVAQNTEASISRRDVLLREIGPLELEILEVVRNVTRRLTI